MLSMEGYKMSKITEVAELVEKGKAKLVGAAVQGALDEGCDATEILNSMIDAMAVVGEKFKNGEIFVPEMLVAARAMKKGVEVLKPHLATGATGSMGKLIIATVAGDLHDIGKNLVAMMIESARFDPLADLLSQCKGFFCTVAFYRYAHVISPTADFPQKKCAATIRSTIVAQFFSKHK